MDSTREPCDGAIYSIRVQGVLGKEWSDWFCGLDVSPQCNHETLLTGHVRDQAALFGLLAKVRDLGLVLLSVSREEEPGN